jgi:uncharacterized membrane protein YeaQ/YmgE (transglycosylase-associated protein family)
MISPAVTLLIILVIGIVAGIIFDRIAGPGWLTRQIAGSTRGLATSALVGITGAFIGFHLATAMAVASPRGVVPFVAAAIGAAVVLWAWRMVK